MLTDPDDMLTTGIEVEARPPGKKVKRLSLLSGGERSLVAVAFLVALFKARPSPFYILDEVEAALDDTNLGRLLEIYEELRENSQLLVITHQKRTMEVGDALYGVTMRGDGVSTVISQRLREAEPASRRALRDSPKRLRARRRTATSTGRRSPTRWADIDGFGHMNNARYFELIDTAIDAHLQEAIGGDVRQLLDQIGRGRRDRLPLLRARSATPRRSTSASSSTRSARSSIVYRVGFFQGRGRRGGGRGRVRCMVYVDNTDPARPVVPIPDGDPRSGRVTSAPVSR